MNSALQSLLSGLIDYAGLFPPAKLSMTDAVSNFARYREEAQSWMLARFITPVARLGELEAAAADLRPEENAWRLSVLPGAEIRPDLAVISAFNERHQSRARIDTIEAKADRPEDIRALASAVPDEIALFIEIPVRDDPGPLVAEIAAARRFAKIRTGGVTVDAFPPPETIVRFVRRCDEHEVAFKATAGLHHPLRCHRALTYDADGPRGTMNGFINLFLAAALLSEGASDGDLVELLVTDDASVFSMNEDSFSWRDVTFDEHLLARTRRELAISFGSCSFEEPVEDLRELGWLE